MRGVFCAALLLVLLSGYSMVLADSRVAPVVASEKQSIGGDFSLMDHHGQAFQLKQLRGKVVLMFFGFTNCSVICPESLTKMAGMIKALETQKLADKVQVLFITVDPERDTVDVLAKYVPYFHSSIIGLTGTVAEISKVAEQYRIRFTLNKRSDNTDQYYTVDHTADSYVLDANGKVAGMIPFGMPTSHFLKVVEGVIDQSARAIDVSAGSDVVSADKQSDATIASPESHSKLSGLKDIDGNPIELDRFRGKPLLINYWATWCPPCREELPSLNRAWQVLAPEGFGMLAVSVGESENAVAGFIEDYPIEFPVYLDEVGESMSAWGIRGMPTTLLLDKTGKQVFRAVGERKWDDPEILRKIKALQKFE